MDHHFRMRQGVTFPFFAGHQQDGSHAGCQPYADGRYVRLDVLHGIVNRHAGSHAAPRAVNIQMNILVRIFRFQEQQLRDDNICHFIRNGARQKNDPVFQQAGINIIGAFAPVILLNHNRNIIHIVHSFQICFKRVTFRIKGLSVHAHRQLLMFYRLFIILRCPELHGQPCDAGCWPEAVPCCCSCG